MNFSLREWKQFRKLTLLIEGRIDDARKASPFVQLIDAVTKEFKSNHTPLIDNWAGQDPTNNQKYLVWVMKQAEAGIARREDNVSHVRKRLQQWLEKGAYDVRPDSEEGQMSPEERKNAQRTTIENYITDLQKDELKVGFAMKTEILANFDKLVKRKMIRGNEADINNYKDWSELDVKVDEALEDLERRQHENEANRGSTKISHPHFLSYYYQQIEKLNHQHPLMIQPTL